MDASRQANSLGRDNYVNLFYMWVATGRQAQAVDPAVMVDLSHRFESLPQFSSRNSVLGSSAPRTSRPSRSCACRNASLFRGEGAKRERGAARACAHTTCRLTGAWPHPVKQEKRVGIQLWETPEWQSAGVPRAAASAFSPRQAVRGGSAGGGKGPGDGRAASRTSVVVSPWLWLGDSTRKMRARAGKIV